VKRSERFFGNGIVINAVPVIILVRVNLLTKYEKILFVFIILLFFISGIFLGRLLEHLLILPPSPDVTVEKADERCAKIENNFPISQRDFDSYGRQLSSTTLYRAYISFVVTNTFQLAPNASRYVHVRFAFNGR
jgi:hypothetical protein